MCTHTGSSPHNRGHCENPITQLLFGLWFTDEWKRHVLEYVVHRPISPISIGPSHPDFCRNQIVWKIENTAEKNEKKTNLWTGGNVQVAHKRTHTQMEIESDGAGMKKAEHWATVVEHSVWGNKTEINKRCVKKFRITFVRTSCGSKHTHIRWPECLVFPREANISGNNEQSQSYARDWERERVAWANANETNNPKLCESYTNKKRTHKHSLLDVPMPLECYFKAIFSLDVRKLSKLCFPPNCASWNAHIVLFKITHMAFACALTLTFHWIESHITPSN